VVKARTPTSAPGNSHGGLRAAGFTLVELLVVLMLIGLATGVASLALRDPASTRLEQEAARLAALLEAGRAEARSSGLPVRFELIPAEGFRFIGLPPHIELPRRWMNDDVQARIVGARAVVLGPEPLIGPQRIDLALGERHLEVATDGLGPFKPMIEDAK
jgi:general secretion pathway protein H